MHDNDGFIYSGGEFFTNVAIHHRQLDNNNPRTYSIDFHPTTHSISITADQANTIIRQLAETLYDQNDMTRETADRLNYLTHVILDGDREAMHAAMDAADYWNES